MPWSTSLARYAEEGDANAWVGHAFWALPYVGVTWRQSGGSIRVQLLKERF